MGTGLAGLTTLLTKPVTYIMTTPETRPATVPPSVLSQPASLPDRFSPMGRVLLDRVGLGETAQGYDIHNVPCKAECPSLCENGGRTPRIQGSVPVFAQAVSLESVWPGSWSAPRRRTG